MRLLLRFVLLPAICVGFILDASAGDLTFAEVKSLPTPRLAERALGEAGKLIMDVDRPRSDLVREQIRFFTYPFTPGSQYGICAADWITLQFDAGGSIDSLHSERRYGVEASIYADPKTWTYKDYGAICRAVKNTRSYFPAPDPQAALTIVAYLDALAGKGPSQSQDYVFDCSGSCAKINAGAYVKNIHLSSITEVHQIECEQSTPYEKCYNLVLNGQPPGLYPRELSIYGTMKMFNVHISRVKLWVGETFY